MMRKIEDYEYTEAFYSAVRGKMSKALAKRNEEPVYCLDKRNMARMLGCTSRGLPRYVRHGLLSPIVNEEGVFFDQNEAKALVIAMNTVRRGWKRRIAWAKNKRIK